MGVSEQQEDRLGDSLGQGAAKIRIAKWLNRWVNAVPAAGINRAGGEFHDYRVIDVRGSRHKGLDLIAGGGTEIKSMHQGTVLSAGWDPDDVYGYMVKMDYGDGVTVLYGHMQAAPSVSTGDHVWADQLIGNVGQTGVATGDHLHLSIWVSGVLQDPAKFLSNLGMSLG